MRSIELIFIIVFVSFVVSFTVLGGNIWLLLFYALIWFVFALVKRKKSKQNNNKEFTREYENSENKLEKQSKQKKVTEQGVLSQLKIRNDLNIEQSFKEEKSNEIDTVYYVHCTGICSNCRRDECIEDKRRRKK